MLYIYTDGSCRGNPGPGGFGVVVVNCPEFSNPEKSGKVVDAYSRFNLNTTNNREEMKAIIWAMEKYGNLWFTPVVYSDSSYAVNTFTKWMWGWKDSGWTKGDGRTPENLDLVQLYDLLMRKGHRIDLEHIKGHAGKIWNEAADQLATGRISTREVMKNLT